MAWVGRWLGGRVWQDVDGRKTFVIRKKIRGREFAVSTLRTTERAALKELERFEMDPEGYDPGAVLGGRPLYLDDTLKDEYLAFCAASESDGGAGNSKAWVAQKRGLLSWWQEKLRGQDLRRLTLDSVEKALSTAGRRTHRVEVIKHVYSWLRSKKGLPVAQDPTYARLHVPQARPGERRKKVKAFSQETHKKLVLNLTRPWGDMVTVLAGTGWHVTELERFIRGGEIEKVPPHMVDYGAAGVLVTPMHKSGEVHKTAVSREVLDAGIRLRARGTFSSIRLYRAIESGCAAAGIEQIDPGQYRHSVATWAIEAGAHPAAVSAFLGHKSAATTKKFYATFAVTPRVPTLA